MDIDYLAIGKRIKAYRKERKMSQEELAEEIDISVPHMCNIENGNSAFRFWLASQMRWQFVRTRFYMTR